MQCTAEYSRQALLVVVAILCSACGSGSAGKPPPDPPVPPVPAGPSADELEQARNSKLSAVLKADSGDLTITWVDTFTGELGFRVDRRIAGGAWETQETLAADAGTGGIFSWQRIIDASAEFRVLALKTDYTVTLQTGLGESALSVDPAARNMQLLISQSEPVQGEVQLSVSSAAGSRSVRYFADLALIGESGVGPDFTTLWNTSFSPDSAHLLQAQVAGNGGVTVELRRSVVTDNPNVAVSLRTTIAPGVLTIDATASADAGISTVQFLLNGSVLEVASQPTRDNLWTYVLDTTSLPAADVTIKVVATDRDGFRAEAQQVVAIDNPPVLVIASPADGAVVAGQLQVSGSFTDDRPGTQVTATLGDVQILQTSNSPFAANYSLQGLPGRAYTLTIRARDSEGKQTVSRRMVVVSSSNEFTYESAGPLGCCDASSLLSTSSGGLLYRIFDGTIRRRTAAGVDTILVLPPGIQYADGWQMQGDYVAMYGSERKTSSNYHVYLYDASGHAQDMSQTAGSTFRENYAPLLRAPWMVWSNLTRGEYLIFNINTSSAVNVPVPPGAARNCSSDYDFNAAAGEEQLFFCAASVDTVTGSPYDIYRYRVADGVTTAVTAGNSVQVFPQTDGTRVAWRKAALGQYNPPFNLMVAAISSPDTPVVLSTSMISFRLRDGIVAWMEETSSSRLIMASNGSSIATIAAGKTAYMYSNAGGKVVFGENGKLFVWDEAHGRRLLLDTLPWSIVHGDGFVFLAIGLEQRQIYRISL